MSRYLESIHQLKTMGGDSADTLRRVSIQRIRISSGATRSWLISFTDLLSLLFAFFVILFAMAEHEKKLDIPAQGSAISAPVGTNQDNGAALNAGALDAKNLNRTNFNRALDLGYLRNIIVEYVEQHERLTDVQIVDDKDNGRLVLILPEELLFASGTSQISEKGQAAVKDIAPLLRNIKNGIEIIGHTDPRPVTSGKGSNLTLSLSRAKMVADLLRASGYERPIPYQGYGGALYNNLPATWGEVQKQKTARRVDIIVHNHNGSRQKRFGIAGQ